MTYPDTTQIAIGDKIWWNEGTRVGVVALVVDNPDVMTQCGVVEPGIFICANVLAASATCDVFNAERQLSEEGITKLTEREANMLDIAVKESGELIYGSREQVEIRARRTEDGKLDFQVVKKPCL